MLRWMLLFEERDADALWVLKTAPRRLYGGDITVQAAPCRYGAVSYSVVQDSPSTFHVNVSLSLHGHGSRMHYVAYKALNYKDATLSYIAD